MRIVVVSAGLSVPSSTRLLGDRLASAAVAAAGAEPGDVRVVELRDLAVEIAHTFTNGFPGPALSDAFDAVSGAEALIVVTPVFSASYSGLFKSFFDALSSTDPEALTGMPVLIAATGGSARHSLVLDHALRPLFSYLRAVVVPTGVYAASEDWGAEGLDARIGRAAGELVAWAAGGGAVPRQTAPVGVPGPRDVPPGGRTAPAGVPGPRDVPPGGRTAPVLTGTETAVGGPAPRQAAASADDTGQDARPSPEVGAVPAGLGSAWGGLVGRGPSAPDGAPWPGAEAVPGGRSSARGGPAGPGPHAPDGDPSPGSVPTPATAVSTGGAQPRKTASGVRGPAPQGGAAPGGRESAQGGTAGGRPAPADGHLSPGPGEASGGRPDQHSGAGPRHGTPRGAPLPKKDTFDHVTPFEERLAALRPGG